MKEYSINKDTLAVLPFGDKSIIYEKDDCFLVNQKPNKIMDDSCKYYGSSMVGRLKGTDSLIGITYKAPIIIEEGGPLVFFPTSSPRLKKCAWVCLNNISKYYYDDISRKSVVKFLNEETIAFNMSYNILNNQVLKANRLEYVLRNRMKEKKEEEKTIKWCFFFFCGLICDIIYLGIGVWEIHKNLILGWKIC